MSIRSKELLQKMKELTWEYEKTLIVVDTSSKKIAVVPMKTRELGTVKPSLETTFRRFGGKPSSFNSDAEAAQTSTDAVAYFRQQGMVHKGHCWTRPGCRANERSDKEMDCARAKTRADVVERRG